MSPVFKCLEGSPVILASMKKRLSQYYATLRELFKRKVLRIPPPPTKRDLVAWSAEGVFPEGKAGGPTLPLEDGAQRELAKLAEQPEDAPAIREEDTSVIAASLNGATVRPAVTDRESSR